MSNLQKVVRHMARSDKQSGQAIVLIAMVMIVLIASLGLAIDGGGMYLLWRDAQNAVDAAAIQAAYAYCVAQNSRVNSATVAGVIAAAENGFPDATLPAKASNESWPEQTLLDAAASLNDSSTTVNEFIESNAMIDVIVGQATALGYTQAQLPSNASNPNDIIVVKISAKKPAFFIQVVYGGPLSVTAAALGACNPGGKSPYAGNALFSTSSYADNCTQPRINISGSYTYFDSNVYANIDLDMTGSRVYTDPDVTFQYGGDKQINTNINGAPYDPTSDIVEDFGEPVDYFPPLYTWEQFLEGTEFHQEILDIDPAYYHYVDWSGKANAYKLQGDLEGVYVIDGDVTFQGKPTIKNGGITIIASGTITAGTGAINNGQNGWKPFGVGDTIAANILMFTPIDGPCNSPNEGIQFGGSGIFGRGLLYAPNAHIAFSASETVWCGAIIGKTIAPSGNEKWFFGTQMASEAEMDAYPITIGAPVNADFPDFAKQYHDISCNYIPDPDPPSFFLGDPVD